MKYWRLTTLLLLGPGTGMTFAQTPTDTVIVARSAQPSGTVPPGVQRVRSRIAQISGSPRLIFYPIVIQQGRLPAAPGARNVLANTNATADAPHDPANAVATAERPPETPDTSHDPANARAEPEHPPETQDEPHDPANVVAAPEPLSATPDARNIPLVAAKPQPAPDSTTIIQVERVILETSLFTTTDVIFEFDNSHLLPASEKILDIIGSVLLKYPELHLEVAGHTDNVGTETYNQQLSEARATAVRNYLLHTIGIAADRMTARGYGEMRPRVNNASSTGRAANRRVEFRILNPEEL